MTRRRFWTVFVPLAVIGGLFSLACMYMRSVAGAVLLVLWTAFWLAVVLPASLRRCDDARMPRGCMVAALVPVCVAAALSLVASMVGVHQPAHALYAAVYLSFVVWVVCLAPLVFLTAMPGSLRNRRSS